MIWLKASIPLLRKVVASSVMSEAWVAAMVYWWMSVRSPVAACTARPSAVSWDDCTAFRPFSSITAKSDPVEPVEPVADGELGAVGPAMPTVGRVALRAPMAGTVTSAVLSDLDGVLVGLASSFDHVRVGLEGPLGHDQIAHLLAHVDVGHPDVALGVGHRALRVIGQPAGCAALGQAGDHHPAAGSAAVGRDLLGLHVLGLEGRPRGRLDGVDV